MGLRRVASQVALKMSALAWQWMDRGPWQPVLLPLPAPGRKCQVLGRTEASGKGAKQSCLRKRVRKPSPTLCQLQSKGTKALVADYLPTSIHPSFPSFQQDPRGKDCLVQLPLGHSGAGGWTCGQWDRSRVCDFQEVSLKGKGQALLHSFLSPYLWLELQWLE